MECQDAKLKVQALIDNELPGDDISTVVDHIQSCYNCRDEYVALLKLQRKLKGIGHIKPSKSKAFVLWITRNEDIRNFYNYIYKDALIYLKRKKAIFETELDNN